MERALQILGYDARREEQRKAHAEGRYVGIGIACCVEDTGLGPFGRGSGLSIELDGTATVRMGTPVAGSGSEDGLCADRRARAWHSVQTK